MAFCSNCGSAYNEGAKFCIKCGATLPGGKPVQPMTASQRPSQPVYQQQTVQQPVYQQPAAPQQPVYQQPISQGQPVYQSPTPQPQPVYQQPVQQIVQPQQLVQPAKSEPKAKSNGMCSAGFVLSLLGVFLFGITSLFGLLFSIFGLVSAGKKKQDGKGKAVAGIILSVVMLGVMLLVFVFLRNPLMDKYEQLTGRTFPSKKVQVDYDDIITDSGWVVAEDGTRIRFDSKDRTFRSYSAAFENSDTYMTGHYELYTGNKAINYLTELSDGSFFDEKDDIEDLFDENDFYYENNLIALTCVYDGTVHGGEIQSDSESATRHFYGLYTLIAEGEQVYDAIKMHNLEDGTAFILIKENQYIEHGFAD